MNAEIICVGTELLLGNIVNTNAAFISERISRLGISCFNQCVVGDNMDRCLAQLKESSSRSDIIILSGGLGPTEDDMTKEAVAKFNRLPLVEDKKSRKAIEEYFAKRNTLPTENNWKQALLPKGAKAVPNANGTAPGIILETKNCTYILLPGPPFELEPMFEKQIMPYLASLQSGVLYSKTVKIVGVGESRAETMIMDMIDAQTNPTIATYAKTGEVHIRVTSYASDKKEAAKLVKPVEKELKKRFGSSIYTTDEKVTLERAVMDLLVSGSMTLSTVESCTGGLISSRIVSESGASEILKCGFVTYSNESKSKLVGVKKSTLDKYGAVSEQTASEMAKGGAKASGSDVCISVTGIAGPDGGTKEKPVGLVYIGCCVKGKVTVKEFRFSGNRNKIRNLSATNALILARECILEYIKEIG
ncbi:MAG: competence/damage-inducible protein A [Lachnospiraceae bacterium]|nr:competence/damage-inducible protein A [Lachnospiraceae bacterium]MBO7531133.1 competence/damage-inducible protein A [Lachnospiraceae bacterium]